jgi:hypothetical protein
MNRIEDVEPQGLFPFFVLFILLVLSRYLLSGAEQKRRVSTG